MNLCKVGESIHIKGYIPTWKITKVIRFENGTSRIYAETSDKYGKVKISMTAEEFTEYCTIVNTEEL